MLDFAINNIFVHCGGRLIHQTIGIPMGTNCASLLVDSFLYAYVADFLQWLLKDKDRKLAQNFYFSLQCRCTVTALNYSRFGDYLLI